MNLSKIFIILKRATEAAKNMTDFIKKSLPKFLIIAIIILLSTLASMFLFSWFFVGNVWIYSNYTKVQYTNPNDLYYCNKTVYLFTFWTITVSYIIFGVAFILGICATCCSLCCGFKKSSKKDIITARV
jgi:hypothetical protein